MIEKIHCGFGEKKCYYRPECLVCFIKTTISLIRLRFEKGFWKSLQSPSVNHLVGNSQPNSCRDQKKVIFNQLEDKKDEKRR